MKDLLKYTLITALVFGASSCADLDEEIVDNYTETFSPENPGVGTKNNVNKSQPNDGLSGAFARLLSGTANHDSYFSVQEVSSDEAVITQKGGDWFDGGIWLTMHKHEFAPTGLGGINNAFVDTYNSIYQCNDLIAKAGISNADKAQLRMLRAYFYWRVLDLFGNVKIVTAPGGDAPQSTRPQVYAFVESELLAALPDLPSGKPQYGRASKAAANALLARLYLNANVYKSTGAPLAFDNADLNKAVAAADAVLNDGAYNLSVIGSTEYKDIFSPSNVENPEHILVATFDEATGTGMNFAQMTLHYPSQLTYKLAEQPWNGYSTLEEFYNSYEAADKRRENNFVVGPQYAYNPDVTAPKVPVLDVAYDKADEDGAPVNYTPKINQLAPNGSRQAGARLGKFSFKIGQFNEMDNDFPVLRLGEVVLNKAEALWRINNGDATAVTLIDQLRTRAGVGTIAPLTEGKFLAERGRELFQESLRRTDLIRFGAWGNAWWEKPAHASNDYRVLFPIPQQQINTTASTPNKLTQNPGYN